MILEKINMNKEISQTEKNVEASDLMIGKWLKCDNCKEILYKADVKDNYSICPNCGKHFRLSARRRLIQIIDEGTFEELYTDLEEKNPLEFEGYIEKINTIREKLKINEAVRTGIGEIYGNKVTIAVMDGNFMMGSMGSVVGEKITRIVEKATKDKLPLIIFSVSGGARMQEGIISLMQMAKTSSAIAKHSEAGLLYISVLTDPTTGGVTASFASLGDIILAEPDCLVGFAGQRVIEQTIKQTLPEGFQKSEFLLEHGFIDKIINRKDMKKTLAKLLELHKEDNTKNTKSFSEIKQMQIDEEVR